MLDGKKLAEASNKLNNITKDLTWIDYNNSEELTPDFNVMAIKSIVLQLKDVENMLTALIQEPEV